MKAMTKKWRKWLAIPLAVVLALAIVVPLQLGGESSKAYATNVVVQNTTLTGQDIPGQFTYVQFDIGWDYSWRDALNWDAVWVFVKYKVNGGDWAHATLSSTGADHSVTTDNGVAATITPAADGKGVFMHRTAGGNGSINWQGVNLKWQYGTDVVADTDLVEGKVFAIEMVYIPQGAFWAGDANNSLTNSFFRADGTYQADEALGPYQVTSEAEIPVGTADGELYYDQDNTEAGDRAAPIPAAFPKGYQATYSMKYEISHGQYAEFLNTLTPTQATARFEAGQWFVNRNLLKLVGSVYGADASDNGVFNEATDGEWIAMPWLSWADGTAYADWAGLRPMTELEFEKISRGTQAVVDDEFAWGTTNIVQQTNGANWGTADEVPTGAGNVNANYGNNPSFPQGPMRVGSFTTASDTREQAGATYYGVMEMSGNLTERTVTVGDATGRLFDGAHGDGSLATNGDPDVATWPGVSAIGSNFRGGGWVHVVDTIRVSDRVYGALAFETRSGAYGFRGVRTAP